MSAPRRSLTKAQLQTAVGLELCQLLEQITDDGRIHVDEVNELHDWLMQNQSAQLAAIDHLLPVMARITEDGVVSPEELTLLQNEIEAVLPPELRQLAKFKRKHVRAEERAAEQAAKAQAKTEADLLKPLARFDVMVAGAHHAGHASDDMAGEVANLVLEPDNPHDGNAIAVRVRGLRVGYLPRDEAAYLAPKLRANRYEAVVKKVLEGRSGPIPVVSGAVYSAKSGKGAAASSQSYTESDSGGVQCLWLFLGFLLIGFLCLISACHMLTN